MVLQRITSDGARAYMLGSIVNSSIAFGEVDMDEVRAIAAYNDAQNLTSYIPPIEITKEWNARLAQLCVDVRKMNAIKGNGHILMTMDVKNAPRSMRARPTAFVHAVSTHPSKTMRPNTTKRVRRTQSRTRSQTQSRTHSRTHSRTRSSTPTHTRPQPRKKRTRY